MWSKLLVSTYLTSAAFAQTACKNKVVVPMEEFQKAKNKGFIGVTCGGGDDSAKPDDKSDDPEESDCVDLPSDQYWLGEMGEKAETAATAADFGDAKVLLLGDSNTHYWNDQTYCGPDQCSKDTVPGSVNLGVAGSTCSALNQFLDVLPHAMLPPFEWVFFICGGNDMMSMFSEFPAKYGTGEGLVEDAIGCGKNVIEKMMSSPWIGGRPRILMPSMGREPGAVDFHPAEAGHDMMMQMYVKSLADASPGAAPVLWVDMAGVFEKAGNGVELYHEDMFHFNRPGYEIWNKALLSAMEAPKDCAIWTKDLVCGYAVP